MSFIQEALITRFISYNMPSVSIIMGVYNCEDTVEEAVLSILNQTFQDFEFIICDDCSADQTYQILEKLKKIYSDKIILLKNSTNRKLSYTLNKCLSVAKGKYIARMDADDISTEDRLQFQFDFLESNKEFDLIGTGVSVFDSLGERNKIIQKEFPRINDLFFGTVFNHATIMMNRTKLSSIDNYTDLKHTVRVEDIDLWFKCFEANIKGFNTKKILYKVRLNPSDLKRRTYQSRVNEFKVRRNGFKINKVPLILWPLALLPLVKGIVPNKLIYFTHKYIK